MGQSLGVENTQGLLEPGDDSILDVQGLVDNSPSNKDEIPADNLKYLEQLAVEASREISNPNEGESELEHKIKTQSAAPIMGKTLNNVSYDDYADYIDRPFSFISDDAEDLRAYGQTTGEKWKYALPKFITKVGANVVGSTAGLVYGGGAFLSGLVTPGESAAKNFWDNDFQRGLDDINNWMDDKLPHYYTKEEQEYNFWRSMGTANFWSNDVANGLSFVTGAVLSEYLSAGMASSNVARQATKLFSKTGKHAGAKTSNKTAQQLFKDKVINPKRVKNGLTTLRQLGTGAMYEAGVESRHHYDETIKHLIEEYKSDHGGKEPNVDEKAGLVDIATKSANAVFAGNVALVGYSNYMMFPKLFGKGFNSSRNTLRGTISNNIKGKAGAYRELFKDIGKKEVLARNAFRVLKTPLYEGFVEEGGQKLLDLSGQTAAMNYYQAKRDGASTDMLTEMLYSMDDRFMDVYGSKEGQKEIGIGFLLGAVGLPTRVTTQNKEGKDEKTWQMNGAWASVRQGREYKKAITRLKERLEKNPSAVEAFENNFDKLVRAKVIQDTKDFASIIDSPWMFKNAENDAVYNYISSRLDAGFESEIHDNIEMIRNMSNEEFRAQFLYNEKNDLTDTQLETRRNEIADALVKRTATIKQTKQTVDQSFVNYGSSQKDSIVHAMAVSEDADIREDQIIKSVEAITGTTLEGTEYEDKEAASKEEIAASKERQKKVTERMPIKYKKSEENSPEGQQVKRKLGIKEFTDPTHLEELFSVLLQKKDDLQAKLDQVSSDESLSPTEKDEQQEALGKEMDKVLDRMQYLSKNITQALDPDLSALEQQYVDEWAKNDPSSYAKNSEEVIQKLKDARKLRARRHRALSMYNELLDLREDLVWKPTWRKPLNFEGGDPMAPPEMMIQRLMDHNLKEGQVKLNDKDLERLYRRHKGTVIEFDYENKDGVVKTYRFLVQDTKVESGEDKVLIQLPTLETLKLLRRKEDLETDLKIADEQKLTSEALTLKHKLDALEKELASSGHQLGVEKKSLSMLLQAKGNHIKTITGNDIIQEYLKSALEFVAEDLTTSLNQTTESLEEIQKELEAAVRELEQYKAESNPVTIEGYSMSVLRKLNQKVARTKKSLDAYTSRVTRLRDDIEILHGLKEDSENVQGEQQADELVNEIFKRQWGGENSTILNKIFGSIDNTVLKNLLYSNKPEYTLQQFRDLEQNQDLVDDPDQATKLRKRWRTYNNDNKRKTLGDILFATQDEAIKLLASVDPTAKSLVDRLTEIEQNIEGLSKLYEITEKGWGISNKGKKGVRKAKAEYLDLQAEQQGITDQLQKMRNSLHQSAMNLVSTIEEHEYVHKGVVNHYLYVKAKMDDLMDPAFKDKNGTEEDSLDTHSAETPLENISKQGKELGMYLNSSPITVLRMMKTTGSHTEALRRYAELQDLLSKGKKIDPIEYAHVQSQLRLFKVLPKLWRDTKGTSNFKYKMDNYRFMVANKNTIPKNLLDKVTFYDLASKSFKYAADMQGSILSEDQETIKLILTDDQGIPVLVDGQPVYSDLPASELYKKTKDSKGKDIEVYRYGKLDLKPETVIEVLLKNGKKGIIGELTEDALNIHEKHISFREDVLQLTVPKLIKLKGVSFTLLYRPNGQDAVPTRASRSIVDNNNMVKDIPVGISLNGTVTVSYKDFNVPKGYAYTYKDGKLIPIRVNKLAGPAYQNVMNLFKLMAVKHGQMKSNDITYDESILIQEGNKKTILQALRDTLYMGKHSFENAPVHKRLNVKGNKIYFGEEVMEFHQLLAPQDNVDINKSFAQFISNLHHQVNYFSLKKDLKARDGLYVKHQKNLNAWKKRKAISKSAKEPFNEKSPTYPSVEYIPFTEFKIGEDMSIETVNWENYTEYLLGDGNGLTARPLDQIPAYSNLVETSEELNAPQFLNSFVTLETNVSASALDDIGTATVKKVLKKKKEEQPPKKDLSTFTETPTDTPTDTAPAGPTGPTGPTGEVITDGKPPNAQYATEEDALRVIEEMKNKKMEGGTKREFKKLDNTRKFTNKKGKKDDCND